MIEARDVTRFPRVEVGAADYLDEFLDVMREVMESPSYFPDKLDKGRWVAKARELFNGKGTYRKGFLTWAVPEHVKRMRKAGKTPIIMSPMTVYYLWEEYDDRDPRAIYLAYLCPDCGARPCECDD